VSDGSPARDEPPLVSVVVPFYDTAEFLDACVESILAQDYEHFELILSDNRSTDGSSKIARRWAERDPRIRYVAHDEFVGQVANYNRALTEISPGSGYTKIVQADDWIYPECLRKMVKLAERHPGVGLVSSYMLDGTAIMNDGLPPDREVFTGREVCRRQLLEEAFFMGTPTTVLYRSEIVRNRTPFYPPESLHEDTEVCYEILRDWDFGFVHQILSFARRREDSITAERREYDPYLLDRLIQIHRFGDDFLSPLELRSVWRSQLRRYYAYLGEGLLMARGRDFWRYHREGLATVGKWIRPLRLAAGTGRALLELLLNPLDTGKRLVRRAGRLTPTPDPEEAGG